MLIAYLMKAYSEPAGHPVMAICIFDEWVRHDVGTVFVQFFDVALGNWLGAGELN